MKRFEQVTPGILRGSEPTPEELKILKNTWGVNKVISLDLMAGNRIKPYCKLLNIEHVIFPIKFGTKQNKLQETKDLSNNIINLLTQSQPVFIHCVHGRDRTGLAIALYRIKAQGWSADKAIAEADSLQFGQGLNPGDNILYRKTIENAEKNKDLNEASDAVSLARDQLEPYIDPTCFDNVSHFSPITPMNNMISGYPRDSHESNDKASLKRKKRLKDMNDLMAAIGTNDNVNPMLRGISPQTVGPGMAPTAMGYGNYYL